MPYQPPKEPTGLQTIQAIVYDALGMKRPDGVMTMEEWRREVGLYWIEVMLLHMAQAIDEKEVTDVEN
jgi:hypothetical protein